MSFDLDIEYFQAAIRHEDLVSLTETDDSPDEINEPRLNSAVARANGDFYSMLSNRFVFPLETILTDSSAIEQLENAVKSIKFRIAQYYLFSRTYKDDEMKDVYVQYNRAFKMLNDIANGVGDLPGLKTIAGTSSNAYAVVVNKTAEDRVFNSDTLRYL